MTKQPLSNDQRQDFLDKLPDDAVHPDAEQKFDKAIARAAQQSQLKQEKPVVDDDYSDTQTRSDTTEDTSGSHSDMSRP